MIKMIREFAQDLRSDLWTLVAQIDARMPRKMRYKVARYARTGRHSYRWDYGQEKVRSPLYLIQMLIEERNQRNGYPAVA